LRQAEAQMESSKAALDLARSDLELYRKLGESSVTRQKIQQAAQGLCSVLVVFHHENSQHGLMMGHPRPGAYRRTPARGVADA